MEWTEEKTGNANVPYNHVISVTPLGECVISWKSWKEKPDYSIELNDAYIGTEYSLEDAKTLAKDHFNTILSDLKEFLG